MNYKISYLLKTPREISLEKAAEIIEVNTSEAVKQLTPFAEYVDDTHIRIKKFRAIDWAEKFLDITRFEAVYCVYRTRAKRSSLFDGLFECNVCFCFSFSRFSSGF